MSLFISRRAALFGAGALSLPVVRTAQAQQTLEWVAGSVGGGWYTMAAGISALVAEENPDIRIRVVPGGGLANSTRVNNNQSNMGWGIDAFTAAAGKSRRPCHRRNAVGQGFGQGGLIYPVAYALPFKDCAADHEPSSQA